MRNYEIMFIVRPTLGEDEIKKVVENFSGVLTSNGAKVTETKEMGQRELAYEIKKFKEGTYMLFNFEAKPDSVAELERVYRITDDIIKFIVVRKEDE